MISLNLPELVLFKVFAETLDFGSLHETDQLYVLAHEVVAIAGEFGDHGPG